MLQKMYTFIIQRGYMGSLIMLTGLDIKRRAVPVYMIIVMSILAIGIKIAEYIFGYKKVDVYEMFIILVVTTVFVVICVISHIMGAADALVMGIIAIVTGIKKACCGCTRVIWNILSGC
jgi:leader peptidase (prepilin peptidase)/N-methyltransferase